jgi:hypothetical protein
MCISNWRLPIFTQFAGLPGQMQTPEQMPPAKTRGNLVARPEKKNRLAAVFG